MLRFRLSTLFIVVAVVGAVVAYTAHRYRMATEAVTSLTENGRSYPDGREVNIEIGGNPFGRSLVVLVRHVAMPNTERTAANLKSELQLKLHYPPDPSISGLWIDGREQRIGYGLRIVYVSDTTTAEGIEIPQDQQAAFLSDAATLDPLQFVDKWIEPNRGRTMR